MQKKISVSIFIAILSLLLVSSFVLVSCEFQKLGLYTDNTGKETVEPTSAVGVIGPYSEEYFYEMKAIEKNLF